MVRVKGNKITGTAGFDFCGGHDEEPYEFEAPKLLDGKGEMTYIACIAVDSMNKMETDDLKICPT